MRFGNEKEAGVRNCVSYFLEKSSSDSGFIPCQEILGPGLPVQQKCSELSSSLQKFQLLKLLVDEGVSSGKLLFSWRIFWWFVHLITNFSYLLITAVTETAA